MRSALYTLLLSLVVSAGFSQEKSCMPIRDIKFENLVFTHGETLKYLINYTWGAINTDVGEATMTLEYFPSAEEPYFYARGYGRTFKFYDAFFQVRDLYESKFYARNMRPFYFHRNVQEGKYRMKNTFSFLPNYQIKTRVQKKDKPPRDSILNGKICSFDPITLFYFARNHDFSTDVIGVEQPISFVIDDEIYDLYYRYLGKQTKRVPGLGVFRTIKFATRVIAGEVFSGNEEIILWLTDDGNRIPVYIESPISVGRVSGRLTKYSNIKHPLSSKIK